MHFPFFEVMNQSINRLEMRPFAHLFSRLLRACPARFAHFMVIGAAFSGFSFANASTSDSLALNAKQALEKITIHGGVQMGYGLGQNGQGWPQPWRDPLNNLNRGGFYIGQVRLEAKAALDTMLFFDVKWNADLNDLQEAYFTYQSENWQWKAGRFRGAGLHSASDIDEFDRISLKAPRYAQFWGGYKKQFQFRDYGIQAERSYAQNRFHHAFWLRNANFQNVLHNEPSAFEGQPITQALGIDYAWSLQLPYQNTLWGHVGALADQKWDEFVGSHAGWKAGYWFKSNPILDASLSHTVKRGRLSWHHEALVLSHRRLLNPADGAASLFWGFSSQGDWEKNANLIGFGRYEFFDETDGYNHDDALHILTLGTKWRPWKERVSKLWVTLQAQHTREEGFENRIGNDVLVAQTQWVF